MRTPPPTTSLAGDPWDSSPPSAAPAAGGWGIPRSRLVYSVGRVRNPLAASWRRRWCRRLGGNRRASPPAAAFCGAPAWRVRFLVAGDLRILRLSSGSSSSLPAGGEVDLLVVELRGRTRRLEFKAGRGSRLLPALGTTTTAARWWCWSGRVLAGLVHRLKLRRGAADGLCGDLQGRRYPWAVVRRWSVVLVFFAGDVAGA